MDIKTKVIYIEQQIRTIVTHDDAPIEEVAKAMLDIASFVNDQSSQLIERRAAMQAAAAAVIKAQEEAIAAAAASFEREQQTIAADEVGKVI